MSSYTHIIINLVIWTYYFWWLQFFGGYSIDSIKDVQSVPRTFFQDCRLNPTQRKHYVKKYTSCVKIELCNSCVKLLHKNCVNFTDCVFFTRVLGKFYILIKEFYFYTACVIFFLHNCFLCVTISKNNNKIHQKEV
jgi:hypothetical protein